MQANQIWKSVLIAAVLAIAAVSLYPLDKKLKPGLDLAGGTVFIYQVEVKSNDDAKTVVESVLSVIQKRLDPSGVRNLVFRPLAGNRIEIQVPLAPKETNQLRDNYSAARDDVLKANIRLSRLDSAIRPTSSEQRSSELDNIAEGDANLRAQLDEMAMAFDALTEATSAFDGVNDELRNAEQRRGDLPSNATEDQRRQLDQTIADLAERIETLRKAEQEAEQQYATRRSAVLERNVTSQDLETVLSPVDDWGSLNPGRRTKGEETFRAELEKLEARHPDRQDQIRTVAETFLAYAKIKGPLDDPKDLVALLRGSGVLAFRIAPSPDQMDDVDAYRQRLTKRGPKVGANLPYRWFVIDDISEFAGKEADRVRLEASVETYFESREMVGHRYRDGIYMLLGNTTDDSIADAESQDGWKLVNARYAVDQNMMGAVSFELDSFGGRLMTDLTRDRTGMPMAIVLDGRVITSPNIQTKLAQNILVTRGVGGFSQREQRYLVNTLNAGTLKARLSHDPISVHHIGPQLGQDNLNRGKKAAIWALIVVAVFMAGYYLFNGMVANFALVANILLILGTMATLRATFTLPGIAGIVLTVGMAVDANVLIFERIREELQRKADLRTAIRQGYGKALVTIIDANLTTLIICIILGYTATAEVKGFAVTLGIGIVATLFTALFCTRVIVDLAVEVAKMRSMPMLPMLVPALDRFLRPNINWIGLRHVFFTASILLIVAGVAAVYTRGADSLDIEFRSGTKVAFNLKKGQSLTLQEVRDRLDDVGTKKDIPQLTHSAGPSVVTMGDTEAQGATVRATAFSVSCLSQDQNLVSQSVKEAFADVLDAEVSLTFDGAGTGDEAPNLRRSAEVVVPVIHPSLGDNFDRPDVRHGVTDFLGGVAILLENIVPSITLEDLTERINRMRLTARFEHLPIQEFEVVGVALDNVAAEVAGGEEARYRSAVVIIAPNEQTDYRENEQLIKSFYEDANGLAASQWQVVHAAMRRDTSLQGVTQFSPQVSRTMKTRAIVAMLLSLMAVVAYIWLRFGSLRYGLAAIVALVHDVTIALGLVAVCAMIHDSAFGHALGLTDFKINLAMVAAVLTIIGYSLNDTIVIFDRVRENRGRLATVTPAIVNDSINQTISRTALTSGTTLLAVLILYIFGGQGVHGFAFAMIIGVFVGTYSSIAIAAPLLTLGHDRQSEHADGAQLAPGRAV